MVDRSAPSLICPRDTTQAVSYADKSFRLDGAAFALYFVWLTVILLAMYTEWSRRTRRFVKGSDHVWVIRLPFLAGVMPAIFTMVWAFSTPQSFESYAQSQATKDFVERCSNMSTIKFESSVAMKEFFDACDMVRNRMDADIGGIGVRVSFYIALAMTIVSSFGGHFHQERTAVKDVGTAQLASMLSIMVALLRSYTILNFWQIMATTMSLDITSASIQMALSQKETLASRWWVVLNAISQLLSQIVLGIVLGRTFPVSLDQQDICQPCVRAIWWGTFDSCNKVPWSFWIYLALRTLLTLRSCAISLHHMHFYDLAERVALGGKSGSEISWFNRYLRRLTLTDPTKAPTKINPWNVQAFARMPATTLTDWILWTLPAAVAVLSLERMLSLYDLSSPGNMKDWGQTTAFMAVMIAIVARALYLFLVKFKPRSCLERARLAASIFRPSNTHSHQSHENTASSASSWKVFKEIRNSLEDPDHVRLELPTVIWQEHSINLKATETAFLKSAALNDVKGLQELAKDIPNLSTTVDDLGRTALHIALDENNVEAIEIIKTLVTGESSAITDANIDMLLHTTDSLLRTPRDVAMPNEQFECINMTTMEAFLHFMCPVKGSHNPQSWSKTVNTIFDLPYNCQALTLWLKAAEKTSTLPHLEELIVQTIKTDSRKHIARDDALAQYTENVFEFCCLQHDMEKTEFAGRLFDAFLDNPSRCHLALPAPIAMRLAIFVRERHPWARKCHSKITRLVARRCEDSIKPIEILLAHQPETQDIDENVIIGAVSNPRLGPKVFELLLQNRPSQVILTPTVFEAVVANTRSGYRILELLRDKYPDQIHSQIHITEAMLERSAQLDAGRALELILDKPLGDVSMTEKIFNAAVKTKRLHVLRMIMKEWPESTKVTSETLLAVMYNRTLGVDICQLFHQIHSDQLGTAINVDVFLAILEHKPASLEQKYGSTSRDLVDFFFVHYPEESKTAITQEVLSKAQNMDNGHSIAQYLQGFRDDAVQPLPMSSTSWYPPTNGRRWDQIFPVNSSYDTTSGATAS
ncbi:hypothetical protein E4T47_06987 [Aureobasidium subglaciale]|nr:hypothetical protein E4T47_06987 [Aureobasidium subglaciale]